MNKVHIPEMYQFLKQYLEINTGDDDITQEEKVHTLFKNQAQKDGLAYKKIELSSGKTVSIISLLSERNDAESIVLNHHLDTVPIFNCTSELPVLTPSLDLPLVYRGAQDMKSIGVAHYFALKTIRESKIKLNKTVHLSIVPDEEKGGTKGTKLFIETEVFKKLNIGFVIDEGIASGDTSKLFIKVNERRPVQIKISVYTPGGHASRLQSKNCLHELIHILNKIVRLQNKQQKKAKNAESGAYDSFNITSISYAPFSSKSSAFNVIPDEASAIVDIRRSPTTALETILKLIEKVTKSNGNATVALCAVAQDAKEPRPDITELYKYMSNAIAKNSLKPEPFIFEATTDLRFYQDRGIPGIGITPFTCNPALHQNNEYIRLNDILLGITIFKDFLTDFGTDIQQETHV